MKFSCMYKRIMLMIIFVFLSFAVYGIINVIKMQDKAITTNAIPITNKIVVVDAGHGKPDEGATGFNGTTEQAINLEIALKLQKLIEQSGGKAILTRSDENGIYSSNVSGIRNSKISDTKNRVDIGNNSGADIFVSIHLNKFPASEKYNGWQSFYQKNSERSKKLARSVQDNLNKNIEKENKREIMPISNIYIMDNVKIPSVIVECGFLSNREECSALKTEEYQNKIVWGIFTGLQEYFLKEGETNEQ